MYSNYGTSYGTDSLISTNTAGTEALGGLLAGFGIAMIFVYIIAIAAAVVELIALYKVFKKAGRKGYEALIPGHSLFVEFEMAGINPIWILGVVFGGVVCIIPFLGALVYLAFVIFVEIWLGIRLAKTFGKGTGFGVLIALVPVVGLSILAFGNAKYSAPKKVVNKPGEDN